jgi:hypothetical protein
MLSMSQPQPPQHPRSRRRATVLVGLAAALGVAAVGLTPAAAQAANAGTAMCANQDPVVGVWVNVSGGSSGWAARNGSGYYQSWSYNTQGKSYSLTVGCGGTPASWKTSTSTPSYRTTWSNVTCFPGWSYGLGTVLVKDRCYAT